MANTQPEYAAPNSVPRLSPDRSLESEPLGIKSPLLPQPTLGQTLPALQFMKPLGAQPLTVLEPSVFFPSEAIQRAELTQPFSDFPFFEAPPSSLAQDRLSSHQGLSSYQSVSPRPSQPAADRSGPGAQPLQLPSSETLPADLANETQANSEAASDVLENPAAISELAAVPTDFSNGSSISVQPKPDTPDIAHSLAETPPAAAPLPTAQAQSQIQSTSPLVSPESPDISFKRAPALKTPEDKTPQDKAPEDRTSEDRTLEDRTHEVTAPEVTALEAEVAENNIPGVQASEDKMSSPDTTTVQPQTIANESPDITTVQPEATTRESSDITAVQSKAIARESSGITTVQSQMIARESSDTTTIQPQSGTGEVLDIKTGQSQTRTGESLNSSLNSEAAPAQTVAPASAENLSAENLSARERALDFSNTAATKLQAQSASRDVKSIQDAPTPVEIAEPTSIQPKLDAADAGTRFSNPVSSQPKLDAAASQTENIQAVDIGTEDAQHTQLKDIHKPQAVDNQTKGFQVENIQTEDVRAVDSQTKDVQVENVLTRGIQTKEVRAENVQAEAVQDKDIQTNDDQTIDIPAKGVQSQEIPAQEIPAQEIPAQEIQPVDTQPVDIQTKDAQPVDIQTIDTQTIDTQTIDTQAVEVPAENIQAVDTQTIGIQTKDAQTEDIQTEDIQTEDIQTEDIQTEDIQTEDIQTEDIQTKDVQIEDIPAEDIQAGNKLPDVASVQRHPAVPTSVQPATLPSGEPHIDSLAEGARLPKMQPVTPQPRAPQSSDTPSIRRAPDAQAQSELDAPPLDKKAIAASPTVTPLPPGHAISERPIPERSAAERHAPSTHLPPQLDEPATAEPSTLSAAELSPTNTPANQPATGSPHLSSLNHSPVKTPSPDTAPELIQPFRQPANSPTQASLELPTVLQPLSVFESLTAAQPSLTQPAAELSSSELSSSETASPEPASPEIASPESPSPEPASPEIASPESPSPEPASPETPSPETTSPEAVSPPLHPQALPHPIPDTSPVSTANLSPDSLPPSSTIQRASAPSAASSNSPDTWNSITDLLTQTAPSSSPPSPSSPHLPAPQHVSPGQAQSQPLPPLSPPSSATNMSPATSMSRQGRHKTSPYPSSPDIFHQDQHKTSPYPNLHPFTPSPPTVQARQDTPLRSLQRAPADISESVSTTVPADPPETDGTEEAEGTGSTSPDQLEKLAQAVYQLVRRRLVLERERSGLPHSGRLL